MIINRIGAEFEYEGVTYVIGASIVGTPESEYEGLYGSITEIRDGEDKDTENETPDIYCSFEVPVIPYDVEELEERFSELYQNPKTIDDIVLDLVIMAPEMICPLDDLKECRHHPMVFILAEDWAVEGEHGSSSEVYTDFDDAKRLLVQKLEEELENGCIPRWAGYENFVVHSTADSYECYIDGEYFENHYSLSIIAQKLCASNRFVRELAEIHKASCQLEDFVSQVSDWDEIAKLTDEKYERMVHDPRFPERLQNALGKNDHYWESYWETVSEVAHELVNEYLEKPDCYKPETDNPYPLCVGNGTKKCRECCLWVDLQPDIE